MLYDTAWRTLWESRFEFPLNNAESFLECDGWLQDIGRRTDCYEDIRGQFIELLSFTPQGFTIVSDYLAKLQESEVDKLDMTALLQQLLNEKIPVHARPVKGKCCEADSMGDVTCYEQKLSEFDTLKQRWSHDWR